MGYTFRFCSAGDVDAVESEFGNGRALRPVKRSGGPRQRARHAAVAEHRTNDLWCADFKEEFKLGNGYYRYPLTVTEHASRALLKP